MGLSREQVLWRSGLQVCCLDAIREKHFKQVSAAVGREATPADCAYKVSAYQETKAAP